MKRSTASSDWLPIRGPWIEFEDANGYGLAQPDFVLLDGLESPERMILVEAKLTQVPQAAFELDHLYAPLCLDLWEPSTLWRVEAFHHAAGPVLDPIVNLIQEIEDRDPQEIHKWHVL